MAVESHADPLLIALLKLSRLPWYWATALVAAVLLLFLILVAYVEGALTHWFGWVYWQEGLRASAIIIYILVIYPFFWRLWVRAVQSLRPLMPLEEGAFDCLVADVFAPNHRREWGAVLVLPIFWLALIRPWSCDWTAAEHFWLGVYVAVTQLLMFGLLSWLIYSAVDSNMRLARLTRHQLELNIFDARPLSPIARWSLGVSLAFVGGISLSVVFQPMESLPMWQNITIYAVLILATVLIFFLSMWSAHSAMAGAKLRELAVARQHLATASRELKNRAAQGRLEGIEQFSSAIAARVTYERRIREAQSWPIDAGIIRRLLVSIPIPGIAYLIRILLGT